MRNFAVGLAAVVLTSLVAAAPAAGGPACEPPVDKFALWTAAPALRGADLAQARVGAGVQWTYAQTDLDALTAAGANYAHISHAGVFGEQPPYAVDAAMVANLDSLVDMAAASGLYVSIAFRTGPGRNEGSFRYDTTPPLEELYTSPAAQDAWAAMWRFVAERYRGHPAVVGYDILVEPNNIARLGYAYEPAEFYALFGGTVGDVNTLFAKATAAIRAADATTPILLQPEGFGSVDWLEWLDVTGDARTVYTVHNYEPFEYTHQSAGANVRYPGRQAVSASYDAVRDYKQANGVPVAVTEFGVKRFAPDADRYLRDQGEVIDDIGANWALWEWAPASADYSEFDVRRGPDAANQSPDESNPVLASARSGWSRSCVRPPAAAAAAFGAGCGAVVAAPAIGPATTHSVTAGAATPVSLAAQGVPPWADFSATPGTQAAGTLSADPRLLDWLVSLFSPADDAVVITASGAGLTPRTCSLRLEPVLLG